MAQTKYTHKHFVITFLKSKYFERHFYISQTYLYHFYKHVLGGEGKCIFPLHRSDPHSLPPSEKKAADFIVLDFYVISCNSCVRYLESPETLMLSCIF